MATAFIWDDEKEAKNLRRHGISFSIARDVFADPNVIVSENYFFAEEAEQRYQALGMVKDLTVVVVIFVDRTEGDVEVIRIISARKATPYEELLYSTQS